MIPLCLVTGFLGSGKTTFLRHLSRTHRGLRLAYLVNDFASVDIDAQALAGIEGELVSLPGGSIFCRCLVTSFTGALRQVAERHAQTPLDGVVIEASGMADPRVVADLLRETRLDRVFSLTSVIAVADPASFRKLLVTLPAVRAQIETADLVLLNKCDSHGEAALAETEAAIGSVRTGALCLRCVNGAAEVRLFVGTSHALQIHGELAACKDPSFLSATVRLGDGRFIDVARLRGLLDASADVLWRAKGFVKTTAGFQQLEWTLGGCAVTPAPRQIRFGNLALICRGDAAERLDRLVAEIEALA